MKRKQKSSAKRHSAGASMRNEMQVRWLGYAAIGMLLVDAILHFSLDVYPSAVVLTVVLLLVLKRISSKALSWGLVPFLLASTASFITFHLTLDASSTWPVFANIVFLGAIALCWIGMPWYLLTGISAAMAWLLIETFGELIGLWISLAVASIVVLINFGVKLIVDNWYDFSRVVRWFNALSGRAKREHVLHTLWLSIPAVVLLVLGIVLNLWLQATVTDKLYRSHLIDMPPSGRERMLEEDAYATIDRREREVQARIDAATSAAELRSKAYADAGVSKVMWAIGIFEPASPDIKEACKGFIYNGNVDIGRGAGFASWVASGFRKSRRGSRKVPFGVNMRSGCEKSMQASADHAAASYAASSKKVHEGLLTQRDDILREEAEALTKARESAAIQNAETFQRARRLLFIIFWWLPILGFASWMFIVLGFLGLLIYLFGRTSFDRANQVVFSLRSHAIGKRAAPVSDALSCFLHNEHLDLSAAQLVAGRMRTEASWDVATDMARHGDGTELRLRIPQWRGCFFRRLFTSRLLLTRVPIAETHEFPPTISLPGDAVLVDIVIDGAREVTFRMEDLAAYSEGVKLRSVYSMHVATEFMGLGAFYCVASGEGRLILRSMGYEVRLAPKGKSLPAGLLLAWDHCAMFSLAQDPTQMGTWLNTASVVSINDGLVVYDESRPGDPQVIKRVWRLFRFAALPI